MGTVLRSEDSEGLVCWWVLEIILAQWTPFSKTSPLDWIHCLTLFWYNCSCDPSFGCDSETAYCKSWKTFTRQKSKKPGGCMTICSSWGSSQIVCGRNPASSSPIHMNRASFQEHYSHYLLERAEQICVQDKELCSFQNFIHLSLMPSKEQRSSSIPFVMRREREFKAQDT